MKAHLSPPLAPLRPGGYDFARDLYFQQIGASGYALGKLTISHPSASIGWRLRIARGIDEMRESINQRIRQVLPGDRGSIASALITGKRGALSAPVSDAFYISSLAHVLAISGYHVVVSAQERSLERTSFESPQLFEFRYVENGSREVTTSHRMASQALPTAAYRACFPASQHRRETTESIEQLALPTGKSDQIWFDDSLPRFGIRLRAGGKQAWLIQLPSCWPAAAGDDRRCP